MKRKFFIFLAFFAFFGTNIRAQYFSVSIVQDSLVRYCNVDSITTASITINDPYNELDTFLVRYTINDILQEDTVFFVDSLHWLDTVVVFVLDTTATMDTLAMDMLIVQDEDAPTISMYSNSYHLSSLACYPTGQDKWMLSGGYPFTDASIDAGIISGIGSNHLITSDMPPGVRTLTYSVYGCLQEELFSFVVESEPIPQIKIEQLSLATFCDIPYTGKVSITSNDTIVFDSINVNYDWYTDILNDTAHIYVSSGYNDFAIYAGTCLFLSTFFVEKEQENILTIGDVVLPHEHVSTGSVILTSSDKLIDANISSGVGSVEVSQDALSVKFFSLIADIYAFSVTNERGCITDTAYRLNALTDNPVPTGFSRDSVFNFCIDGTPIAIVSEIGNAYQLTIWKVYQNSPMQVVFDSQTNTLPWDKTLNGEELYGYFIYALEITNPDYIGEKLIRSYFWIF